MKMNPKQAGGAAAQRRVLLVLMMVAALILGACGGEDEVAGVSVDADSAAQSTDAEDPQEEVVEQTPEVEEEPDESDAPETIADLLGFGPDGPSQAEQEEMQRQAEEKVAACMIEQGFEYKPFTPDMGATFDPSVDRDTREYAEENGFGLATEMAVGIFDSSGPVELDDPNAEYVASLSEGESQAYYAALYGDDFDREPELDEDGEIDFDSMVMFEPQGCSGAGQEAFAEQGQMMMTLMPSLMELEDTISADSRILAMDAEWSACMADAGYDYPNQRAVFDDLMQRVFATSGFNGSMEDGGFVISGSQDVLDDEARAQADAEIDEVAEYERGVAVASYDCGGDDREAYGEIRSEYEQRFIEDNRDLIDSATG